MILLRKSIIIILAILLNLSNPAAAYYTINWGDLMYQMQKRMSWQIARMETVVQIFDPFFNNSEGEPPKRPIELPARSFKQVIHWQDGKALVVETHDEQGELLHFHYENNADQLSISLNDNRSFSTADILPRELRFRSRYEENRSRALQEFGIVSKEVAYHIRDDNHVFLRIGNLESGHYALLNPKTYELSSMHNRIWQEDGSSLDLTIVFKKYETYRWQTYAKVTEYFFDKKLFKRMTVSKIRTLSRLPVKKLKKQAFILRRANNTATLLNDYAL